MSELEERIGAVLSDPEQLSRLTQMASKLMGGAGPKEEAPPPAPGLGSLLKTVGSAGRKPLLDALSPYLDEDRRRRLARALRLAATARLAESAFREMGGSDGL